MEQLISIKIFADGRTEPSVHQGTEIILIQEGKAHVGKLFYEQKENSSSIYIDHPQNQFELDTRALQWIAEKAPHLLKEEDALLVICPEDIRQEIIWGF